MADADTDIETPELVELQDEISKTSTEIVNELPADSDDKGSDDLLTEGQKKLPAALQEHILNSKKAEADEEEESKDEMNVAQAIPDDDTPAEETQPADDIFQNPVEQEPPAGEFHPPLDEKPETEEVDMKNKYAEVYAAHAMSQRVASMPLSEYEDWLFPPVGSPDHLRGQMCLARIEASLKAANGGKAVSDLWQIKIGAALWSRLNYREGNVEETRREVEKAPPMELMPLIPKNAAEAISVIEEMQASTIESPSKTNWGMIGACAAAVIVPLVFIRRG